LTSVKSLGTCFGCGWLNIFVDGIYIEAIDKNMMEQIGGKKQLTIWKTTMMILCIKSYTQRKIYSWQHFII
jgi:hypothetical protein